MHERDCTKVKTIPNMNDCRRLSVNVCELIIIYVLRMQKKKGKHCSDYE